jgi:sugar phosphate isomerase/epimerase
MSQIKQGVSLYSFQHEYFHGLLDLDGQFREVAAMGATGIEVIPHQTFASFPNLTDAEVDAWFALHDKYGTEPTSYNSFCDVLRLPDRRLTFDEMEADLRRDIDLSQRLGCSIVRIQMNTPVELFESNASYAADHGQRLALEVHSPLHFEHRWVQRFIDAIHRVDNGHLGLMGDMSTFTKRFPRVIEEYLLRRGADPEMLRYVLDVHSQHQGDWHTLAAEVLWRGGSAFDQAIAGGAGYFNYVEPETLVPHLPYLFHIQAKFWEMLDDGTEYSIPYATIVPVLIEHGWSGYLSSEYEGNRYIEEVAEVDSVEQLRRQHAMFARLLAHDTDREGEE